MILLNMSIQNPILLPKIGNLLTNTQGEISPKETIRTSSLDRIRISLSTTGLLKQVIQLISGDRRVLSLITNQPGESSVAGLVSKN